MTGCAAASAAQDGSASGTVHSRVSVTFSHDGVCMVFQNTRVAEASDAERAAYISAQRQCMSRILSNSPKRFELQTTGSVVSPVAQTLKLQSNLLSELPILLVASDTSSSTDDESSCDREQCSQMPLNMNLPCSVWGFVSLLLILDGCVRVDKILQDSSHGGEPAAARLPVETLEAAAFFGCEDVRKQLLEGLQAALQDILQHYMAAENHNIPSTSLQRSCSRIWHLTEVLQSLHGQVSDEVFTTLCSDSEPVAAAFGRAVHLPTSLLARWLEVSAGPVLDLQNVNLTSSQWTTLLMCFAQTRLPRVTTLHLSPMGPPATFLGGSREFQEIQHGLMYHSTQVESESRCCCCKTEGSASPCKFSVGFECPICRYQFCPTVYAPQYDISSLLCKHSHLAPAMGCCDMLRDLKQFCTTAPQLPSFCISCSERVCGKPDCVGVGFPCVTCQKLCPKKGGGVFGEFSSFEKVLSDGFSSVPALAEYLQMLRVLGGTLPHLSSLQHFGLQDIPMSFDVVPLLGLLFGSMPKSVETVTISTYVVPGSVFGVLEKTLFFRAVVRAPGLRVLNMPQWEAFVGEDARACVEVLRGASYLETVCVSEVKDSSSFPVGVTFRAMEDSLSGPLQKCTL